ncbi:MAG: J domain-containing protein [Chitinophaga sp.]|uniref:J domain-containing protein n=1 Tax=Chitinophaga sp. TaxID=1869181 RepID=UPI0025C1622F|nr:J domain-containing protein [Chitinophaga sp.]MBV8252084.1 J domain-containing protein [Chitinophaga sp.]
MINYYSILELSNFATGEEVKKAHRLLSKRYHPDLNPGNPVAEEKFKQVQHAYEQLNNTYKKSYYDDVLRMNLYAPPQSHNTYTNSQSQNTYSHTQSQNTYHQAPPYYTQYASNAAPVEEAVFTPQERKRNLVIRWAIVAAFAITILLGAIFGPKQSYHPRSTRIRVVHDNEKYYLDPDNTTGVAAGDPASQVTEMFGKPDNVQYESGGIELWSYSDKLVMIQHHKVVWVIDYANLEKMQPDSK